MKIKILYIIIISIIIFPFNIMSQNNKIGYANIKFIFRFLPEVQDMNLSIKNLEHKFRNTLKENLTKFQIKLNYYQREYNNMPEKVKTNKENELEKLRNKIQKLQIESQTSIIAKQLELSQPIYDKIQKSIEENAAEKQRTERVNSIRKPAWYVLNTRTGEHCTVGGGGGVSSGQQGVRARGAKEQGWWHTYYMEVTWEVCHFETSPLNAAAL